MPGPPKKPSKLKLVQGNPGKKPLPSNEPMPGGDLGKAPLRLPKEVREAWEEIAPLCWWATESDRPAFERLCRDLADLRRLDAVMDGDDYSPTVQGSTGTVRNPVSYERREAEDRFDRRMQQFGLTPASRTKCEVPKRGQKDEIAAMMEGKA